MQTQLTISVQNLAPENGTSLTQVWFGIHDGGFEAYDRFDFGQIALICSAILPN